jgi:hypothetical protein
MPARRSPFGIYPLPVGIGSDLKGEVVEFARHLNRSVIKQQ